MNIELKDADSDQLRFRWYEKQPYKGVFHLPPGPDWQVEAVWDDAYHQAAKRLIEGVARGEYLPAFEGVAGLYLFRHYVEVALKFIIFHSRWLKDAHTNARFDEIEDVKGTHSLKELWSIAEAECQRIMPDREWRAIDVNFVSRCIKEFDQIDPNGTRFRYHGSRFGVEKDLVKRQEMAQRISNDLHIDFHEMVGVVEHVYDVLNYLDTYMIETHGQNEEWEEILSSL